MTDLTLLSSFLEVAETGSISRAAERLFVTQPALSRRLQQLEAELDATLFERTRRGVALTEQGRYVLREARDLVDRYAQLRGRVAELSGLQRGCVRLGGGATAVSFLLPEAIAAFQAAHPGVLFQVKEAGSRDTELDVAAERLELGIVTLPVDPGLAADLEVTPLATDRITLVASRAHELAGKKRVSLAQLEGRDCVGFEAPSAIRSLIDGALRDAGVHVNVVMELRSIPAILRMVTVTNRLAFVSQLGLEGERSRDVVALPVTGLRIQRRLAILQKRGRPLSPAAAAFVEELRGRS
ncbi:MAG: LysR family transcriptional regulator [Planctomycetes bacterium]|nr:LysR family transcriptional regulator [Planctomycetota bacterium]